MTVVITLELQDAIEAFERAAAQHANAHYVLRLYLTGATPTSVRAVRNVRKLVEQYLADRCDLEVIDIYQRPALAVDEQIIAAPTLVKQFPLPIRRFVGDLSNTERLLAGLDLNPR